MGACEESETAMLMNRTKRQTRRAGAATPTTFMWSGGELAGLHTSAYCPSSISLSLAFGVLGNRPGQLEVVQISDQRQVHL